MCLYPKLIQNPKYKSTKKNGGNIPPIRDDRVKYVPIGCTRCIECRKQKARMWQGRLLEDIKTNKNGKFVTLTFNNKSYKELDEQIDKEITGYERDNAIATKATRLFLERYRKHYKKSIRHWLVTELGHKGTQNIHLHGIFWTDTNLDTIEKIWSYGFIWKGYNRMGKNINYVNEQTASYISKYIHKMDLDHKHYQSKVLTSPGIGANYTKTYNATKNNFKGEQTIETYRTRSGHEINLPIYWRNKIYTEQQREQLWLQKLDKQERWICGEKISIKNGYEQYDLLLQWYRKRNIQLGYGTDEKSWQEEQYENMRRDILNKTRIKNAFGEKYSKGIGLNKRQAFGQISKSKIAT